MASKDLVIIEEAVTGYGVKKQFFLEATKKFEIIPTSEIEKQKKEYKSWFDKTGKIKTQILKNELFVIEGKTARGMWLWGDILSYMEFHESYRELGYESMRAMFQDPDFPIGESTAYVSMSIFKRFNEDTAILLKSKVTLLGEYFIQSLSEDQIDDLITTIGPMSNRQAKTFIERYKVELLRNGTLLPRDIEDAKEEASAKGKEKKKEYIRIIFEKPKFQVKHGRKLELDFFDPDRQQIGTLALRELIEDGIFEKRMTDIANRKGFEKILKKLAEKGQSM